MSNWLLKIQEIGTCVGERIPNLLPSQYFPGHATNYTILKLTFQTYFKRNKQTLRTYGLKYKCYIWTLSCKFNIVFTLPKH